MLPPEGLRGPGERLLRKRSSVPTWSHPRDPGIMFSLSCGYLRSAALTDELVFTADLLGTPHTPMFLDLKQFTRWPRSNPTPGYFPEGELFFPCPHPPPISAEMFPEASSTAAANWKQTRVCRQRGCAERKTALRWQQLWTHVLHGQDAEQENTGAWALRFQLWEPRDPPLATDRKGWTLPGSPPGMGLEGACLVGCHRRSLS